MIGRALVVVDVQHDFASPEGALYVPRGEEVATIINTFLPKYDHIIFTRDWHPEKTVHFDEWPKHCVADSDGAKFAKYLSVPGRAHIVNKGMDPSEHGYSPFRGGFVQGYSHMTFDQLLEVKGITDLDVCGLATDFCVKATVLDAVQWGYKARILLAACRAVNQENADRALEQAHCVGVGFAWRPSDQITSRY